MNETTNRIPARDDILRQLSEMQATLARDPVAETERNIRRLAQAIRNSSGRFALNLAVCNDRQEQKRIGRLIASRLPQPPVQVMLTGSESSLLDVLLGAPGAPRPLFVYGLEQLLPSGELATRRREDTLHELQLRREQFRSLGRPLLLWLAEYAYTLIGQQAVDFWSWQGGGFFFASPGLAEAEKRPASEASTRPRRGVSNLPVFRGDFVRRPETADALEILRRERGLWIAGEGGTGKTTFALALAEELKDDFPDAQILLEARRDQGSEAAARMIRQVLWLLNPETGLPDDAGALRGLYLSALTYRRCVIVLDNVEDPELIRSLLPPPGSVLIATSRVATGVGELGVFLLGALSTADARQMLLDAVPSLDSKRADRIAAALDRNPLAIRLVAVLLRQTPSLERQVLQSAEGGLGRLLQATFVQLYERLDPATAAVLRRCTIFPASFDREAEAAVGDDPDSRHLLELDRLALIYRWKYDDRFELHQVVRGLAQRYLSDAERLDVRLRHADYYLTVCRRIREAAESPSPDWRQLLDAEWENIKAGQAWAAANYPKQAEAARLASHYPIALGPTLMSRLSPKERERWFTAGRDAARLLNDPGLEAIHLCELGRIHALQGRSDEAMRVLSEASQKARQSDRKDIESAALNEAAWLSLSLGRSEQAGDLAAQALKAARVAGDESLRATALMTLTRAYARTDRFQDALRVNEEAIGLFRRMGDRRGLADGYQTLGQLRADTRDLDHAADAYQKALEIVVELGDIASQSDILLALGTVEMQVGQAEQGMRHLEEAVSLARSQDDPAATTRALETLAQAYVSTGDVRRAHSVNLEALEIANLTGSPLTGLALVNLGVTAKHLGDYEGSERYLLQARSAFQQQGKKFQEAQVLLMLGASYAQLERYDQAEQSLTEAAKLASEIHNPDLQQQAADSLSELRTRRGA